jgi:hypothetical protein
MKKIKYLVGIGAHRPNKDRPKVALAKVPEGAPIFIMMHNPDSFAAFPANTAPIAVARHTHGGQIRLPLTPQWSWLTFVRKERVILTVGLMTTASQEISFMSIEALVLVISRFGLTARPN